MATTARAQRLGIAQRHAFPHGTRLLLDCRLLGPSGAGRTTELLLRSLAADPPPGRWLLWGPAAVRGYAWDGAEWIANAHPLLALKGQRDVLALPPHDIAVYLHQIRPLRPGPSLTLIYDTIQIRYNGSSAARAFKRLFLMAAARLSTAGRLAPAAAGGLAPLGGAR